MRKLSAFLILLALLCLLIWKNAPSDQHSNSTNRDLPPLAESSSTEKSTLASPSTPRPSQDKAATQLEIPAPDLAPFLADARERDRRKLPFRFATPIEIGKNSSQLSPWRIDEDWANWELEVHAEGARSLNFAFDQFHLPPGASLSLQASNSKEVITFTSQDNAPHGELWTPIFRSETVRLTAQIPLALLSQQKLRLAKVNYGFREKIEDIKIGGDISGSCNVDVVCTVGDVSFGDMIDAYREQIRSVGAYTLNGIDTCTGALINNTDNDNTPYFLTADHCEISPANASSVVVYWNFENSTCRPPGSAASGSVGDGDDDLTIFNSGASYRAAFSSSDFCLIELDQPVVPASEAYFAGWNRVSTAPTEAVAIHHPAVAEKRISFEFDSLSITDYYGNSPTASGTHLRVADWDIGTTEGGSSGSPLFNPEGQIIGQLHGGDAGCGNNEPDWYGRTAISWTGGGSSTTRLSDWLAPSGSAPASLDGLELSIRLLFDDIAVIEGDSGNSTVTLTITTSSTPTSPISFDLSVAGGSAQLGTDYLDPGTQSFTLSAAQPSATLTLTILGDADPEENEDILLSFTNVTGATPPSSSAIAVISNDDFITPDITSNLSPIGNRGSVFGYQIEALNTPTSFALTGQPAGMTIDPTNGLITWESPLEGSYQLQISASNNGGTNIETLSLTIEEPLIKQAFDVPSAVAISGDLSAWNVTTEDTFDGLSAIELTNASDSSDTTLTFSLTGPDELTFWTKVSTEYDYDIFSVSIDGVPNISLSGETNWHPQVLSIPSGNHTVSFRYLRDSSIDGGFNAIRLDRFTLTSLATPLFTHRSPLYLESGNPVSFHIPTFYDSDTLTFSNLPIDWKVDFTDHLQGTPNSSFSFDVSAENDLGETSRSYEVNPFTSASGLANAIEQPNLPIRSESPSFFAQSTAFTTGVSGARSANMNSEGRSSLTTYILGPGTLRFQWLVSSEPDFDYGYILHNGEQVAVQSGVNPWAETALPLSPGLNEVTWLYVKDESLSENQDALFVDNLRLEGYANWVTNTHGMSPFSVPLGGGVDGDENQGLLEYAVGLSPSEWEEPHVVEMSGPIGNLTLSTPLDSTAENVTVRLQKSLTLEPNSWNTLAQDPAPLGSILTTNETTIEEKAFFRIQVTSP